MEYRAKKVYQGKQVVESYNSIRFKSLKGKITNWLELRLIDKALKYAHILPSARILDVPCGTGRLSLHLLKKGYSVTGADISSEMVRYTNERLIKEGISNKIVAKVEDAEKLSFPDNDFDVGISLRLLGHTPPENRLKILQELNRVCSKCLVLVYYSKNCVKNILRKNKRSRNNTSWYPVSIPEIDLELKKVGLKKDEVYYLARGLSETIIVLVRK